MVGRRVPRRATTVWKAFALPGAPPEPVGVGAAQPSPYAPRSRTMLLMLALFIAAAVLIHLRLQ